MKILYLECNMGAAGDMLMSALSELVGADVTQRLNGLNIPSVLYEKKTSVKCGVRGTHIDVLINGETEGEHAHCHHEHHHTGMSEIEHIIGHLDLPEKVRGDALSVYKLIARAESEAHGCEAWEVHFHEVGAMDAVADVVGVCMLMNEIAPDKVVVSPIHVGSGQVMCAHGILPVPAPATANILRGTPIYGGKISGELCTPTGAALIKYFADEFGPMPVMKTEKIGYGMGSKDFETANCLRAFLGETDGSDTITELCCNIDDMTGEEIGFAVNTLLDAGAAEVFTQAVYMKKNRPGTLLTCLCRESDRDKFVCLIFKHTTTIGIRERVLSRYVLDRREESVCTKYGDIHVKISEGYGVRRVKPEYDDLKKTAEKLGISLYDLKKELKNI